MRKFKGNGTCGRWLSRQPGVAVPTVLAAILVLTLVVAAMAGRVRATLRAASLDAEVAQGQVLVQAAFREVALRFDHTDPSAYDDDGDGVPEGAPDPTQPKPAGWSPCSPRPISPAVPDGAAYCAHVLAPVNTNMYLDDLPYTRVQVPVMIRWRLRSSYPVNESFGWITYDDAGYPDIYYHHTWCRPSDDFSFQCEQGG